MRRSFGLVLCAVALLWTGCGGNGYNGYYRGNDNCNAPCGDTYPQGCCRLHEAHESPCCETCRQGDALMRDRYARVCVEECAPSHLGLGSVGNFRVTVKNMGTAHARNVVVTEKIAGGLQDCEGRQEVVWEVGDLAPNECKIFELSLKATEVGKHQNVAVATAANSPEAKAEAFTDVVTAKLNVTCMADTREPSICKNAVYSITVTNTGNVDLSDVTIVDEIPSGTDVSVIKDGQCCNGQGVWYVGGLAAGASETVQIALTSKCPLTCTNRVYVTACNEYCGEVEACAKCPVSWKGHPCTLLHQINASHQLCISDSACYRFRVSNDGTAPDSNVLLTVTFPPSITPRDASGGECAGTVNGQVVTFGPYKKLGCGECMEFSIAATANEPGEAQISAELSSAGLNAPVKQAQGTYIY